MGITHLSVDDHVLFRLALMSNPCSFLLDIWLRSECIRRSSLSYMPSTPNSRELGQNSALVARTKKINSHHRELMNFIFVST